MLNKFNIDYTIVIKFVENISLVINIVNTKYENYHYEITPDI